MRPVVVRRTAFLLGVTFLACAGLFAWLVSPAPPGPVHPPAAEPSGAASFRTYCASCHTAESLRPAVTDPSASRDALERFMEGHGDAPPDEDRLILDYLAQTGAVPGH